MLCESVARALNDMVRVLGGLAEDDLTPASMEEISSADRDASGKSTRIGPARADLPCKHV